MIDEDALRELAADRSRAYWVSGELFATRPERSYLDDLAERLSAPAAAEVTGLAEVKSALDEPDRDGLAERLSREHLRLFGGIDDETGPPPPYESVHREGRLMGSATEAVLKAYAEAGIGNPDPDVAPGDHIAAEFKFMSLLCHQELTAWESADRKAVETAWRRQHGFLHRHLLAWVPDYCRRLREEAREPFYAGCAALAERVLDDDRAALDDLMAAAGVV